MTIMKQGALAQVLFVAVDKNDFATIESGVTSNFSVILRTVKQGVSDATSAVTLSRVPSVVNSGIFKQVLKSTETASIDDALLIISHASCATQIIPLSFQLQDLSGMISDVDSAINSQFAVTSNYLSNASNYLSNISALVSDVDSQLNLIPVVNNSAAISNMHSDILSYLAGISDSVSNAHSDLRSQISGLSVGIDASDISDIASKVWSEKYNTYSLLASSFGSFVTQQIQGASNMLSNISALVSDVDSQLTVTDGVVSDVLSNVQSGFVATSNAISDMHSDINSYLIGMSDMLSNVHSTIDDMSNVLSDVSSRIPAALVGGRMDADMGAISTSTDAANKLEASAETLLTGAVNSDIAPTISNFSTTFTETTDNHYNGRVIIFTSGDLIGQATTISDYIAASSQFDVVNLTEAPSHGDSFVIV